MAFLKRKIITLDPRGRMGNRLQTAAYVMAYALENDIDFLLLHFDKYNKWFYNLSNQIGIIKIIIKLLSRHKFIHGILKICVLTGSKDNPLVLTDAFIDTNIKESWITIIKGYFIYSQPYLLVKHYKFICDYLSPALPEKKEIEQLIDQQKRPNSKLVGLHIRRGDYKSFKDGVHYFTFDFYGRIAESLIKNHADENFVFLICSDESIDNSAFRNLNWISGPGHPLGDMYALSLCDYIMGPFSSFNRWSAYYGRVPRYEITAQSTNLKLNDFEYVKDLTYPETCR
jgi:hypothetical protein